MKMPAFQRLRTAAVLTATLLLAACGGGQVAPAGSPPASTAAAPSTSAAPASKPAASTKPVASSSAAAKPAASSSAAASGSAAAKPSAGLTKLTFRYPVQTGAWIPFMIAADGNIFQKYGLDVDVKLLQSSLMIPAMLNHEMDIAATSPEKVISAYAKGANDLRVVGAMIPEAVGYLIVSGDINTVEDLKGKTVVLSTFGNVAEFAFRRIFSAHHMELGKDVQVRAVQTTPAEIAALAAGNAQGFMAYPPDDVLVRRSVPSAHSIFDVQSLKLPYVQGSIFTTESFLTSRRPVMVNFMKAVTEAINVEKHDHDFAIKTFMKYARLDDKEAAERALSFYGGVAPEIPAVGPDGIKNVMEVVAAGEPSAANLNPASVIDTSVTDELAKTGFAKQLQK